MTEAIETRAVRRGISAAARRIALLVGACLAAPALAGAPGILPTALLPQPVALTPAPGPGFVVRPGVGVEAPAAFREQAAFLSTRLGLRHAAAAGGPAVRFIEDASVGQAEGAYRLHVREREVRIEAAGPAGAFYGVETLLQLLPPDTRAGRGAPPTLPAVDVEDAPRFAWRGLSLDVARHFFGVAEVERVIDSMAAYKLNRLHLHLTDDSAWRVAIRGYPRLTTIGARGDAMNPDAPARFYTEADIRRLVRYAAARQIEIVPEIEMPGHAGAAARAYPEFFDGGHTFNPGRPGTYAFIDKVLTEVTRMFPGRTLHFGGDEVFVAHTHWAQLPEVVALARTLDPGAATPDLRRVEAEFARRVAAMVHAHGRTPMGWDEIVSAGFAGEAVVQWWRAGQPDALAAALEQGQAVVLSPMDQVYLDYSQGPGEPGAPWDDALNGHISAAHIAAWEPLPAAQAAALGPHVLGVEACLWTELVSSDDYLEYMLYPRLAAVAEVAWRQHPNSDAAAFTARLVPHIARWRAQGRTAREKTGDAYRYILH